MYIDNPANINSFFLNFFSSSFLALNRGSQKQKTMMNNPYKSLNIAIFIGR